jgi:hypothetical protein
MIIRQVNWVLPFYSPSAFQDVLMVGLQVKLKLVLLEVNMVPSVLLSSLYPPDPLLLDFCGVEWPNLPVLT